MTHKPGPAQAEEQAELRALRARTAADARQAVDTMATLADKITESARPPALARQAATALRSRTAQATRRLARRPVVAVRGRMAVVVGVPSGVLIVAVAVLLWQHRRAS